MGCIDDHAWPGSVLVAGQRTLDLPTPRRRRELIKMTQTTAAGCRIVRPADPGWRPTPKAELAHLRLCWGRLYQIGYHRESGQWVARYLGSGEQLRQTAVRVRDSGFPWTHERTHLEEIIDRIDATVHLRRERDECQASRKKRGA